MTQLIQCLWQDKDTLNFVWQIIDTKKATSKIVETRHGSFTDIPHTELPLNETIRELPNHFVHWSGKIKTQL